MKCHFLYSLIFVLFPIADSVYAQAQSAPVSPEIVRVFRPFGEWIGEAGIVSSKTPGINEVYLDGRGNSGLTDPPGYFWQAVKWDVVNHTYIQTFASRSFDVPIDSISVADFHRDPGEEILVVLVTGELYLYDEVSRELLEVIDTGVNNFSAFTYYDLNNDGIQEYLLVDSGGLHLFSNQGLQFATFFNMRGADIVVGQMDSDPSLEIAVTTGKVLDLDTGVIQCNRSERFGNTLRLSDFDNDGMQELVFSNGYDECIAYDVDTCSVKWTLVTSQIDAIWVGDSDQDGLDDLILGENSSGVVYCVDLVTQALKWTVDDYDHAGTTSIAMLDIDGDGDTELHWGTGLHSGKDYLAVADIGSQSVIWKSRDLRGPFFGPLMGDVDGDGIAEVVTASQESDSGSGGGCIVVLEQDSLLPAISPETLNSRDLEDFFLFDADGDGDMEILVSGVDRVEVYDYLPGGTFNLIWSTVAANYTIFFSVHAADIDGDGDQEILIGGSASYDGLLEIYDFSPGGDFTLVWQNNVLVDRGTFTSVDACDIDGDGEIEILGGAGGFPNAVYAYNLASGDEEWHSTSIGVYFDRRVSGLTHGDFDGDGELEIAVLVGGESAYVFENDGTMKSEIFGPFSSLRAGPDNQWPPRTLILGNEYGDLSGYGWNGVSFSNLGTKNFISTTVAGFSLSPWSQRLVYIGSQGMLNILHRSTGNLLWQSGYYGWDFGEHVIPLDNGDIATAGSTGVFIFGIR